MDYFTTTQLNFPKIENPFGYNWLYLEQLPSENQAIVEVPPLESFYEPNLPPLSNNHYDQLTDFQDFDDLCGNFFFDNSTIYCEEKPQTNYVTTSHEIFASDICNEVSRFADIREIYANLDNNNNKFENENSMSPCMIKMVKKKNKKKCVDLLLSDIQKYFDFPIKEAAKELGIGVTRLKKRCRELGIKRWPHRKLKSLKCLITNVKKMGVDKGDIVMLEEQKRLLEIAPNLELTKKTKKLRQACFKANYKNKMSLVLARF